MRKTFVKSFKDLAVFQKHPVDFCRPSVEARARTHAHNVSVQTHVRGVCAIGAREQERKEEESREKKRVSEHACTLTRSRARMHATERVLGCENRRAKSSQWRAEAGIGGVTHVVNERPIRAPSPVDFELVSRSAHRVCVRARERRTRGREKRKKKQESARASKERATNLRKKKRERASDGRGKKEEERRVCIASRLPPYSGRQRGEGERQKEGHNMPNERAP